MLPDNDKATVAEAWIELHDWADATMQEWTRQAKLDWRRQQRSEGMVRQRNKKKGQLQQMQGELHQLERQFKEHLVRLNSVSATSDQSEIDRAMHRVFVEIDSLSTKNIRLREKLRQHHRLQSLIQQGLVDVTGYQDHDKDMESVYEASEKSQWRPRSCSSSSGWRVCFQDGEPSFYFHPLTREQFDAVIKPCYDTFGDNPPEIKRVGTLFGWDMHCAPPTRREDTSVVSHARFTTPFACSLDELTKMIVNTELTSLPLISTPSNWNRNERSHVSIQVLQEFEKDAYVLVCNIPGPVHLRYLYVLRQVSRTMSNGKRKMSCIMVITSTKANERIRSADEPHHGVEWVHEGGTFLTLTEVEDGSADLSYDHWQAVKMSIMLEASSFDGPNTFPAGHKS
ncbi:hypothetical protein GN244_ATG07444 [Phytophthora infestans]|uniref:START domain-containing protein n=1 Tax=Phytophthora infestans TaxID=4787 RepID=A0A833TG11_PHYIN|nr:hypothetical protein GN244_ATG07444 [Phytophthora infestans]KAF4131771.1 hypothetical protein GN958_ATG19028 [Phytophthora infestans]KAI9980659.1 hypothetical protein PInf_009962 [Phytophthora infestans]